MPLDFASITTLTAINLAVIGLALPWVMGTPVSHAAQRVQRYFLFQALAWGLLLLASRLHDTPLDPALSLAATCAASAALWHMAQALQHWLEPRPLRRVLVTLCVMGPVGFALLIHSIPLRMAWYGMCHAAVIASLGWMCLHPRRPTTSAWRYLLAASTVVMAVSLLARAYWAANTPWLHDVAPLSLATQGFAIVTQVCGSLFLVSMLVAWRDETHQQLRDLTMTDPLTGLANRHALLHAAPLMQAMAKRQQLPLAVLLIDIDHFKAIHDEYGHAKGEQALQLFATVLRQQLRSNEIAARWGEQAFSLLLYAQNPAIEIFYQRFGTALHQQSQQTLGFALHISAGCALQPQKQTLQWDHLLQQADAALCAAKRNGGSRLAFENPPALSSDTPTHRLA